MSPAWSPDGKRVLFARLDESDPAGEIYVMNADGSGQTRLTISAGMDMSPTWSKDGKRIAFVSTRGDPVSPGTAGSEAFDIYIMDAVDGRNVVRVTSQLGDAHLAEGEASRGFYASRFPSPASRFPLPASRFPAVLPCRCHLMTI
jgi:Tol biopolymer transport system component